LRRSVIRYGDEGPVVMINYVQQITDQEADSLIELIYEKSGIVLSVARKSLVLARLGRRLRHLGIETFTQYIDIVRSGKNQEELMCMIDEITTNKTEFFREVHHFQYLSQKLLPEWSRESVGKPLNLRIFSLGCSTGEEPYSIAMTMAEHFRTNPGLFTVTCLDISRPILHNAKRAVYRGDDIQSIPQEYRKYLMVGKDKQKGNYRIVPELRARTAFEYANIADMRFKMPDRAEIVFSRNVMIYFDKKTIADLVMKIEETLVPGGHLFIGHSETLNGLNHSFVNVAPTVYMKPKAL
jgi:chemotaxis protein methyltransferase CheR